MDSQQVYGLRVQVNELTVEAIIKLIQDIYQEKLLKTGYLLMAEGDIAALATKGFGYFPGVPSMIAGVSLVPLPGLEHGTIIAGFFG